MKQKWIEYILMLVEEVDSTLNMHEIDLQKLSIHGLKQIADQLEEIYKMKGQSEALDVILAEVKEHGVDWARNKYGF